MENFFKLHIQIFTFEWQEGRYNNRKMFALQYIDILNIVLLNSSWTTGPTDIDN